MIKTILSLSLIGLSVAFASEETAKPETHEMFWKTVNTILLFAGFFYVVKKYVIPFFQDRRNSIENMIKEAENANLESKKALEEANKKLEEAKYKLAESVKIAEETAEMERKHAIQEAEEMAERIKKQAKEAVEVEIRKGELQLKKYAVEKALEVSEKLIREKLNENTNKAIIQKTLKTLEA